MSGGEELSHLNILQAAERISGDPAVRRLEAELGVSEDERTDEVGRIMGELINLHPPDRREHAAKAQYVTWLEAQKR